MPEGGKSPGQALPMPEDDRMRQAYFLEGKGIKQIAKELHHHRKTVRKAIYERLDLPCKEKKRIAVTEEELSQLIQEWAIAKGPLVTGDDFDSLAALLEEHHLSPKMANLEKAGKAFGSGTCSFVAPGT